MKVLWLANIPSPYRVKFFNELGKHCELTVLFERKASLERNDSWKNYELKEFRAVFLRGKRIGVAEAFCPSIISYLKRDYDHIVVTTFSDLTGILAILYMKFYKIPYEIESDGAFPSNNKGIREKIKNGVKRFLLSGAKRYFSTAKLHDEYYKQYGAKEKLIIRYPFSSVYEKDVLEKVISVKEKDRLRKELKMNEKHIVLAVRQFIPRKGYDILLQAAAMLDKSYGIYVIGGIASEEYIIQKNRLNLNNLYFLDFKQPDELKKYYMAADVFVHPTREDIWGLVINEAMALGLPVVTTNRCIAGLEMVKEKENGFIIPAEDKDALKTAICKSISTESYKNCALTIAKKYTIEKMVYKHILVWKGMDDK